jgi:hypothetical protein
MLDKLLTYTFLTEISNRSVIDINIKINKFIVAPKIVIRYKNKIKENINIIITLFKENIDAERIS